MKCEIVEINRHKFITCVMLVMIYMVMAAGVRLAVLPFKEKWDNEQIQIELIEQINKNITDENKNEDVEDSGLVWNGIEIKRINKYNNVKTNGDMYSRLDGVEINEGEVESTAAIEEEKLDEDDIKGIGILSIPRIDCKLPVTNGVSKKQLDVAIGWVPETKDIGKTGNAVILGHRSYTYGKFFNRLDEVREEDIIEYIDFNGNTYSYKVYSIEIVEPDDITILYQPQDKSIITLVTCTPIRIASHRLVVKAFLQTGGNTVLE